MEHSWRDAAIATGLISSVPTLVLPFIPERATKAGSGLQRILLCFAVGGMMGDVFLHLLPHLLAGGHNHHDHHDDHHHEHEHHDHSHHHDSHDHDHHDDHHHGHEHQEDTLSSIQDVLKKAVGMGGTGAEGGGGGGGEGHGHGMADLVLPLLVLGGFMLFFISERIVRSFVGGGGHSHSHSHSHGVSGSGGSSSSSSRAPDDEAARRKKDDDHASNSAVSGSGGGGQPGEPRIKMAGILNLAADALHNLSDGIAIGAAFASGSGLGYSTALATLLHELPHEIGDFAVLVQSGCTKWQAIGAQFATALAAFAGTAIGLLATKYAGLEQPLLAATAGGFVYVSCVGVMPDILNGGGSSPSFLQGVAEVGAMCSGIALMACVALLE